MRARDASGAQAMTARIVGSSLRLRLLVLAGAGALLLAGVLQLRDVRMDALPEFTPPYVEIQTEALGLSADEVEQLITVPLEANLLNGVAWLDRIGSRSVAGLSSILLVFQPGTNVMRARQLVQERLTEATALPRISKPPTMLQPLSSANRVMMVGLSSARVSPIELGVLARWSVRPRLLGVSGVANVAIWGQRERQLQVQVDPERLRARGVSLQDVISTAGNALWVSPLTFLNASTPGTGGFVDTPNQRLGIRHVLPIRTPADLSRVSLERPGTVRGAMSLGDVASVVEAHQPLIGDAVLAGGNGLVLVIEKLPGTSTLEVTRGIDAALAALRPGLSGIAIEPVYRPAGYLERSADNLALALLAGAALLLATLVLVFSGWRAAAVCFVSTAVSMLAALLVLDLRSPALNPTLVAGLLLATCTVVGDAIVHAEHVRRRLAAVNAAEGGRAAAASIVAATRESRGAVVVALVLVAVASVPLLVARGVAGAFLEPVLVSYWLGLLAAAVVALTLTPVLASLLLAPRAPAARGRGRWLERGYERSLAVLLRRPLVPLAAAALVAVAGVLVSTGLDRSRLPALLPSFRETDLLVRRTAAPGTSLPEMRRIVDRTSRELRALDGVRAVGAHVGRAILSDRVTGVASADLWVRIDPAADYGATVAAVREVVSGYPGLAGGVGSFLDERVEQVAAIGADRQLASTTSGRDLVVRVYGEEPAVLRTAAGRVERLLASTSGLAGVRTMLPTPEPTVEIAVDLAAAERRGTKPGDVRRAAAALLQGIEVGSLFEQQKVFDVIVVGTPASRRSLTSIRSLLIDTPRGQAPLGELASVRVRPAPTVIEREAVSRYLDVRARIAGGDAGGLQREVGRRLREVAMPLGYHAELRGSPGGGDGRSLRLLGLALAALVAMYLVLQAAFGSWRLAAAAFLSFPVALAGGLLAVAAIDGVLSLGALVGLLAVLGIAARDAVLLVGALQRLGREDGALAGPALVVRAARERLLPAVAAGAAVLAVTLPLVLRGEVAGLELLRPLALAVAGGAVASTLASLYLLPVLSLHLGGSAAAAPQLAAAAPAHAGARLRVDGGS